MAAACEPPCELATPHAPRSLRTRLARRVLPSFFGVRVARLLHVDTAPPHVGCDQHARIARAELGHDRVALFLHAAARTRSGGDSAASGVGALHGAAWRGAARSHGPRDALSRACGMSPCIDETVKLACRILLVSQSTLPPQGCKHPVRVGWAMVQEAAVRVAAEALLLGVAEDDSLRDRERIVQVAQRVKLPLLALDGDGELRGGGASRRCWWGLGRFVAMR
eukprot:6918564-Prymnesium_polylepis.3